MNWKNILLKIEGDRADIKLNRPELHNAINPLLITEFDEHLIKFQTLMMSGF